MVGWSMKGATMEVDYKILYEASCKENAAWRRMCGVRIISERKDGLDRWFVKDKDGFPVKVLENEAALDHEIHRFVLLFNEDIGDATRARLGLGRIGEAR